ncbi:MAG: hypothetical protein GXO29_05845 [Thermotogae bacterium]|nr:hypothetical protein [Thermotogota bacterium]
MFLLLTTVVVGFSEESPKLQVPKRPVSAVKVLRYLLAPGESLSVRVVSTEREEISPELYPSPTGLLTGRPYPDEPIPTPRSPVMVRYGWYRGKKVATVVAFEITSDGERFYRNRRIVLDVDVVGGAGPASISMPGADSLDLVILTTEALKPAFDSLAEFKNLTGIRTAVFTVDEAKSFPGRTPYERIRNFVRYLYGTWGVRFLLIGGDESHVPAPDIDMPSYWPYDYGTHITTDAYYGSMDGDWNANGDWSFGQFTDSLDLWLDVAVGRIPVNTLSEAYDAVRRIEYYESHYRFPFPPNVQLFASKFILDNDACTHVSEMAAHLPPELPYDSLCEMDVPVRDVSLEEFVDSVESATFVMAFSHSNYQTFLVNIDSTAVPFLLQHIPLLNTDSTPPLWIHMGCLVNAPTTNSINVMLYKWGKVIASYGPSRESSPGAAIPLVGEGFRMAFGDTTDFYAGMIDLYGKHFIASIGYYFSYVYEALSYNLVGDPSLRLYRETPLPSSPSATLLGDTLSVVGAPPEALITLMQGGRILGRWHADASGSLSVSVEGLAPEPLKVGIYRRGYLPTVLTVPAPGFPNVRYSFPDVALAGDTLHIEGYVLTGGAGIDVKLVFVGEGPLGADTLIVPAVGDSIGFHLRVPVGRFAGETKLVGYLTCSPCGLSDTLFLVGRGPMLRFIGAKMEDDSTLNLLLLNEGAVASDSIRATFVGGTITPTYLQPASPIPPQEVGSLRVALPRSLSEGDILRFTFYDGFGDTVDATIIVPDSLPSARLTWSAPGDGYVRVMWDGDWESSLVEVDTGTGWRVLAVRPGGWGFVEDGYDGWDVRCYRVLPVVGGIVGQPGPVVCNRPNPPEVFVRDVPFAGYRAHLLAADIHPSPGYELVVPSVYNYLSVFSADGRLLWRYSVDTLPSITEISAPPAVGDIDGDGDYEIVFGIAGDSPRLLALGADGSLEWSVSLPDVPIGPVVLGLFRGGSTIPDVAVKMADFVRFYDGHGNLIGNCGPYVWADEYMSAGDISGDGRWELVVRGDVAGSQIVVLNSDCEDTTILLPNITYVGTRIYDADGDGDWELLANGFGNAITIDLRAGRMDSTPIAVVPRADVVMPVEWDGTPGWEFAYMDMYDFAVSDGDGTVLYAHHDDIHPRGRRFVGGDVDGDGREEVFFSTGRSVLFGKTHHGDLMGFPIVLGHEDRYREEVVQGGPLLYDLDGDGKVELCAHTSGHHLYCWKLGSSTGVGWPMVRGNRWNSGFPALEMPDTLITSTHEGEDERPFVSVVPEGDALRVEGWNRGALRLKIYTVAGREVKRFTLGTHGEFSVLVPVALPRGVYVVVVEIPQGTRRFKVILR